MGPVQLLTNNFHKVYTWNHKQATGFIGFYI